MAEEAADDEAIYDVWRRLTEAQVAEVFYLLEVLANRRRRGGRPTEQDIADAMQLRDGPLHLGFLPVVQEVLDNA